MALFGVFHCIFDEPQAINVHTILIGRFLIALDVVCNEYWQLFHMLVNTCFMRIAKKAHTVKIRL